MPKDKNLEAMSVEDLESLNQDLMAERAGIKARQREVAAAIAAKQAAKAVATMTDVERAALAQAIAAQGIEAPEQ